MENSAPLGVIDQFVGRYVKEYDFYSRAAFLVAQVLESDLKRSGVRCIVTHRAKDVKRLEKKCHQRAVKKGYETVDDIYDDIVDLAGVRIALYFPSDQSQVEKAVHRLLDLLESRSFPESNGGSNGRRFSGYSATHYRVKLIERELSESDKRYATARVEVQVASVLMHAWSEVEHDLAYKPLSGHLSETEESILDQLNGLVLAGELSLKMLQEAGKNRVASNGTFSNHYELAAYLLSHAGRVLDEPVGDSGLGRVDLLFSFLQKLNKESANQLSPYLNSLHGNVEMRPLAEQVIDALLAEDSARYEHFLEVQEEAEVDIPQQALSGSARLHQQMGHFLTSWIELEGLLRSLWRGDESGSMAPPITFLIRNLPMLDSEMRHDINMLRRTRNAVVHGGEVPSSDYLAEVTARTKEIAHKVRGFVETA
ncbi:GTP pyrophosphokinase [Streptomyces sp. SS10]